MAELQPLLPRKISQSVFPPIDAPPTLPPLGEAAMGGGLQSLLPQSKPTLPTISVDPHMRSSAADPNQRRMDDLQDDLDRRTNPIAPTTTLGKIGHVAAGIGNVLGNIFAPATMALIPGTQLNNEIQKSRDRSGIDDVSQLETAEAGRKQTAANTAYTTARPAIEQAKLQQKMDLQRVRSDQAAAKAGQKPMEDDDGVVSYVDDPDSAAYQSRKIHDDTEQARQDYLAAQSEVDRTKNDPSSPAYKLAITRAEIAKQNANAAITRAQAYYGGYLQHAFNKDLQGNVLPGAPQISDGSGGITTVGSTNAPQAVKAQANVAQFGDVEGALGNLEGKAKALVASGGRLDSPSIVYALQHATGTPSQIIQSLDKAALTPEEREYVTSNLAAHENVQALRKSAGGTATDSSVAKLDALLPNGSTPDIDYLLNQTGQIRQTAQRLGMGVTTVKGGLKLENGNPSKAEPTRPANVPAGYHFNQNGPKGAGWYK